MSSKAFKKPPSLEITGLAGLLQSFPLSALSMYPRFKGPKQPLFPLLSGINTTCPSDSTCVCTAMVLLRYTLSWRMVRCTFQLIQLAVISTVPQISDSGFCLVVNKAETVHFRRYYTPQQSVWKRLYYKSNPYMSPPPNWRCSNASVLFLTPVIID